MKTKEEKLKEIQEMAEQLQDSCHSTINAIVQGTEKQVSYQDATNTWLFLQFATLKYEFKELKDLIHELAH